MCPSDTRIASLAPSPGHQLFAWLVDLVAHHNGEARRDAIDGVLTKHAKMRELVDNEWIHLFRLDGAERTIVARRNGEWR